MQKISAASTSLPLCRSAASASSRLTPLPSVSSRSANSSIGDAVAAVEEPAGICTVTDGRHTCDGTCRNTNSHSPIQMAQLQWALVEYEQSHRRGGEGYRCLSLNGQTHPPIHPPTILPI